MNIDETPPNAASVNTYIHMTLSLSSNAHSDIHITAAKYN